MQAGTGSGVGERGVERVERGAGAAAESTHVGGARGACEAREARDLRSVRAAEDAWPARLLAAGSAALDVLGPRLAAADPENRVAPRSRLLCAALGLLGREAYEALGERARRERRDGRDRRERAAEVMIAAAALSLLTKVDDEVIDRLAFHGGWTTHRRVVRARTEAFLAPTFASLRSGLAATNDPRCALAADVGLRLHALAGSRERLGQVLEVIAEGWRTQVDAVATLSSHPGEVSLAEVTGVTRRISGAWLLMIALVGSLPAEARPFTPSEQEAFYSWGLHIQRADALADLQKDVEDGLITSFVGRVLWEREPSRYVPACERRDAALLFGMAARHRVDALCLQGGAEPAELGQRLAALGGVHDLLAWIHGFLIHRYLAHPLCQRDGRDPAFRAHWERRSAFAPYLEGARAGAPRTGA